MKKMITILLTTILLAAALIAPAGAISSVDVSGAWKDVNQAVNAIIASRTITYDCNGGTFISLDDEQITMTYSAVYYPGKAPHTVPDDIPIRLGYIFNGWACSDSNTYYPGDTIDKIASFTMTAQWESVFEIFGRFGVKEKAE